MVLTYLPTYLHAPGCAGPSSRRAVLYRPHRAERNSASDRGVAVPGGRAGVCTYPYLPTYLPLAAPHAPRGSARARVGQGWRRAGAVMHQGKGGEQGASGLSLAPGSRLSLPTRAPGSVSPARLFCFTASCFYPPISVALLRSQREKEQPRVLCGSGVVVVMVHTKGKKNKARRGARGLGGGDH